MKKLPIAFSMLLAVALVCFLGICTVTNRCESITGQLARAEALYIGGDAEGATLAAESLEKDWVEAEAVLSFFVNQDRLEEIGLSVSRLAPLARANESQFLAETKLARILLLHLQEDEKTFVK